MCEFPDGMAVTFAENGVTMAGTVTRSEMYVCIDGKPMLILYITTGDAKLRVLRDVDVTFPRPSSTSVS